MDTSSVFYDLVSCLPPDTPRIRFAYSVFHGGGAIDDFRIYGRERWFAS